MKQGRRIALLTFVWLSWFTVAFGQRQDTIYESLATNYIPVSNPLVGDVWGPVTNIGQAFHQAYLNISPQTGKTCHSGDATGGFANATFFTQIPGEQIQQVYNYTFTYNVINPVGIAAQEFIASVINHPYVYIRVQGIDKANCQYTLIYTGSLYPGNLNPQTISPISFGFSTSGSHTMYSTAPCCIQTVILSLVLSNSAANQTVTFKCGSAVLLTLNNLAAGQVVTIPFVDTNKPIMTCYNDNLTVSLLNSTEVDFNIQPAFW